MQQFQPEREPLGAASGPSDAKQAMAARQSAIGSSVGGGQAPPLAQSDGTAAPAAGIAAAAPSPAPAPSATPAPWAAPAPSAASGKPKWAALLRPGGSGTADAPGQAAATLPGLGKTQAGNLLATLANQPVASSASPTPAAPLASPGPPSGGPVATPAQGGRVTPQPAPAQASIGQRDPQQRPVAGLPGAGLPGTGLPGTGLPGATPANYLTEDNGAAEPEPSHDDILPLKPRASFRLRSRFRLR